MYKTSLRQEAAMITKDEIKKIRELKARGYSQEKVAKEMKISRSTVQRHWRGRKLKLEDLFIYAKCVHCKSPYPHPKFLSGWECPACRKPYTWYVPWF
jgi:predicted DNA-binding protein (UPF0251 family)